ncbi:MAG TPA: sigma-54 dependent transcriptional regulator [Vicinamibacterales bacterium]
MSTTASILVIDDEEIMREILETLLTREGYSVRLAGSAEEGLELARSMPFDVAIVDLMLPGMDGIAALEELKKINEDLPVLMITAFASVETAIAAMKRGAFDYVTKPFKNDEVLVVVRNAVERNRLVQENRSLRRSVQEHYQRFSNIIGRSPKMRQVFDLIIQAAPSRSTILIQGESGTGKELVARALHANSPRADRAFVTVNSGNLPPDLLESTLFGHVKGAFTGAIYPKKGLFDLADKGSIFFDEMGNIAPETQAKLLRVMQEREFMRLGGMETIRVDVRIIAATNTDLKRMVDEGRFREDLYYRLNVISIHLPPLRERKVDIPALAQHFLQKYGEENHKEDLELAPEALDLLMDYDWPGNVRELENVIERAVVLTTGPRIGTDLIPDHVRRTPAFQIPEVTVPPEGISFKEVITDFEKRLIESTLEAAGGVQKRAAELLHIKPTTLNEMIKRYDIRPRRRRTPAEGEGEANGHGQQQPVGSSPQPASGPISMPRRISAGFSDE